jgi:S-adenosylmethionine hydrolase
MRGTITFFDRFGNAATNIPNGAIGEGNDCYISIADIKIPVVASYDEGETKELSCIKGSDGTIEIFCKNGNAKIVGNLEAFTSVIEL